MGSAPCLIPFSMHNVDEVLLDVGIDVPAWTKARQWLMPIDLAGYRHITPTLAARLGD